MYISTTESLCCISETKTLQINSISIKIKQKETILNMKHILCTRFFMEVLLIKLENIVNLHI